MFQVKFIKRDDALLGQKIHVKKKKILQVPGRQTGSLWKQNLRLPYHKGESGDKAIVL